ncbi:LysR family transcriptional regulator [Granulibacter bethesdensis]|uniref:Transcriptional regulator, LysR family n=1 Tax=Granulibacter bethesdensis (strain ATCC BAA-1260 / CGDNIH1) TaxID=391165 RepID=Q0BV70_GRABC|nr:LysR family transcriptional regulator [Granulibacter bethesdensis]ABI61282.1 Transcriptional regulator, LysR family [Granulibacter bethesdensis CGDNIH1]AHJ67395.1 Transcriptional regulator, LysR family [Granulibacter bethesdensis]APH51068.1 Transcriptional regulator, LysR family [Granulibacter bethesdensis]APH63762.1 Transcriptional regulator, LysR family [Granulibacter bethesdensis]
MDISFEQLTIFVATAETGSFSAAGRHLGKAQSAISTAISNMEIDLGVTLFSRAGRTPSLTEAGTRLLAEARVVLDRHAHFIGVARSLEKHVETRLVLAVDELYPEPVLARLLHSFAEAFPSVELEILFPFMEDVSRLVLDGQADLGIMWRQETLPAVLGFHTLGWVPLQLVCARDHPLAEQVIEWEELKRHRQLMVATRSESEEKRRLRIAADVWWVESQWVILQLARQGIGWAFVSDHIIAASSAASDLVIPRLAFDTADWPVAMELIWHKQRPQGPASQWLAQRFISEKIGVMSTAGCGP